MERSYNMMAGNLNGCQYSRLKWEICFGEKLGEAFEILVVNMSFRGWQGNECWFWYLLAERLWIIEILFYASIPSFVHWELLQHWCDTILWRLNEIIHVKYLAPHKYSHRIGLQFKKKKKRGENQGRNSNMCVNQANLETGKRITGIW